METDLCKECVLRSKKHFHQGLHCLPSCHNVIDMLSSSQMDLFTVRLIVLTLKVPSKICSRWHFKFFFFSVSEKISPDISHELSAWQTVHMKCQNFFCLEKKKSRPLWLHWMLIQLVIRRLRVQTPPGRQHSFVEIWSWNIFYGHCLPSADSRRADVSFWQKNVHNTG